MSIKLISAEQLSSLAETVKDKINVLDTVPATVNGGLWLDGDGSVPVIKLFYNGDIFKTELSPMPDPQLIFNRTATDNIGNATVSYIGEETGTDFVAYNGTVAVTVPYLGEGNITVSSDSNSTVS